MSPKPTLSDSKPEQLSILSFGAGAIGTYIGGSLALQGHQVTFLERQEVSDVLKQRGLRLKLDDREHSISKARVAASLAEAIQQGPYDAALFALKSYDTDSALKDMQPFQEQLPPVVCLQNGVENEPKLAALLGREKVIAASVTSAIGRRAAGDIVLERLRGIGIAAKHPLSSTLANAMNAAGLNARLYANASDMKWSKMLTNLLVNATSAILNLTPAEIFNDARLCRLEIEQLREALRVMHALNLQVVDLPGTPVRALALAARGLPVSLSRNLLKNAVGSGRGSKMPSFHIDLHSGRGQSEVDYLNGAVVRGGQSSGVPTPVNLALNRTLLALTNGEIPLERFARQPEKLLAIAGIG